MNRNILLSALFILSITVVSFADDAQQVITLKDGSQVVGELVGINNGVYTIKAPIIGNINVSANDVVTIANRHDEPSSPGAGPAGSSGQPTPVLPISYSNSPNQPAGGYPPDIDQRIEAQQRQLMANPQSMALLVQMAQDPEIAQLLQDPALVDAVSHHDLHAVETNPRIKELMSNPKVQEFLKKLEALQNQNPAPAS